MEAALEAARAKDAKERMAGVERLHQLLEASRKPLSSAEVTSLVDCCLDLSKDTNFRISQGALQCLASAAVLSGHHFKLHLDALVPPAVERLGDGKQPVRDAARHLLLTLMEISSPTIIVERAGTYAWTHKSWKVREEYARTVTSAIGLFASTELPLQRAILPPILQMLNDSNHVVQEAAISCIEEMYTQVGPQFRDELQRYHLPTSVLKDINSRLERIEPKVHSSDGLGSNYSAVEIKPAILNPKRSSSKAKSSTREVSLFRGDCDITEKRVDPVKVYSEKELIREVEKIASILVPDKDWSLRIGAMQRVEGLVIGGAADYPCFRGLLKHLVGPLSTQLSDRRSTIVKQACHLLNFLSKELLGDFEACAEVFILILFKLVVITVLVIAESADNCIKTMLRNCKVVRVLPHIADSAKNDRSFILRARCCEYALLMLEYWADEPEIQRAADLYEDLIKCCVADAMSEVRATARTCYRMFTKTWPERSRQLFLSFDPVIQRVINEENGSIHRRHASPSLRDRSSQISLNLQPPAPSNLSGYGTSAIVAMEKSSSLASGVDPPSSRDPPFPLALPASHNLTTSFGVDATSFGMSKDNTRNGALGMPDIVTQIQASKDSSKLSYCNTVGAEPLSALSYHSAKRAPEKLKERGFYKETSDSKEVHRPFSDVNFGESQNSYVPNFQRPLLKKNAVGRMSASRRRSFDDNQLLLGDMSSFVVAPVSLNDTLSEGNNPSSDWNARVAAFNYLRSLLQQGPKGIQEVTQNFEKVMKLFFQHLDDPHHKVAQAALLTLSEIIPPCRKPFESYMDRVLPRVFLRLVDPKELVRQPCSTTLEIVGKSYGIDSLLPALLRSLDEQRSPKAKLAVIQFAISSFNKHPMNSECFGNSGILKLWLAKLTSLAHDKNIKLKEAAVSCIISVYSHYDSVAVLNFILSLSVDEQNSLRRVLKQFTPRIEVDLINFMQNKKERPRPKSYDPSDVVGTYAEEGYSGLSRKTQAFGRYSGGSVDNTGGRNWSSEQEPVLVKGSIGQVASDETQLYSYRNPGNCANIEVLSSETKDLNCISSSVDCGVKTGASSTPRLDMTGLVSSNYMGVTAGIQHDNDALPELDLNHSKLAALKLNSARDTGVSIPQILHLICNGNDENPTTCKRGALQQLFEASVKNDHSLWAKYFNQILTVVLEVLDDSESSIQELGLSLIFEMLRNQKDAMEDSIEIIIEKLLHVTKDVGPKVADEAEQCLTHVLSQYDPFRCLSVITPLLVTEDEKTLITCINCITKLVGRLSQEELTGHLPSFLPALFEAFGNQSADVRKTVVFCLVDIYIILGKAFLPHLEGLNSTQLRLVTIYANRISQARTGTIIDANHS